MKLAHIDVPPGSADCGAFLDCLADGFYLTLQPTQDRICEGSYHFTSARYSFPASYTGHFFAIIQLPSGRIQQISG